MVVGREFQVPLDHHPDIAVIQVKDTLQALGDLAAWWRKQHSAKVAAITGSAGKTTTKEMTAAIFEVEHKTLKNPGNHNNLIGLPVTFLNLNETHKRVVVEMGMNHRGEIARLTEIAAPEAAAIVNVGMAHLEGLGNIDGVAEAKTELIAAASAQTRIILNGDDAVLMRHADRFKREYITFGLKDGSGVRGAQIKSHGPEGISFDLIHGKEALRIRIPVPGIHNVKNALAAAAIALSLEAPPEHIVEGLRTFRGVSGRFQCTPLSKNILLIDDTYNANPSALKATLLSARQMVPENGRLIVGLGDMLELGAAAVSAHLETGALMATSDVSWFFAMGNHAKRLKEGAARAGMPSNRIIIAKTHDELIDQMIRKAVSNDVIFLKGSRMMQFEKVSEGLKNHFKTRSEEAETP